MERLGGDNIGVDMVDLLKDTNMDVEYETEAPIADDSDGWEGSGSITLSEADVELDLQREERQNQHINEVILDVLGKNAKYEQTAAIRHLVYNREDLIFIAGTSYGKSMIFQAAPFVRQTICLIIVPLKAIQRDQVQKLGEKKGAMPIILDGDTNNKKTRKRIADGDVTHGRVFRNQQWVKF